MGTNGDEWGPMGLHRNQWGPMGMHGDPWGPLGIPGDRWGWTGPFWGPPHHDGGQLHEGEAAVELRLAVLDDANVGGRQRGKGSQGCQDGVQAAVRVEVAQDDGWGEQGDEGRPTEGPEGDPKRRDRIIGGP